MTTPFTHDDLDRAFTRLRAALTADPLSRREALIRSAALGVGAFGLAHTTSFAQEATPDIATGDAPDPAAKSGGTLRVGLQADPTAFDPHLSNLTAAFHIIEHVYNGLLGVNAALEPIPELAESWEVSDDGLTYTFHLRDGVTFHNGRAFTSDDVKYTFERITDPATASPRAEDFAGVTSIETPDDLTAVFTLGAPDASFISKIVASGSKIVAKEVVEENGNLENVLVGTGPFTFVDYVPNSSVSLQKYDGFWLEGRPYVDAIEFQIVPESTSRTAALVSNTVDFIEYAPVQDLPTFEADSSIEIAGDQNTNIRYASLNISREPFDKLEVRQAIAKVIDRQAIIDASVFGYGTATATVFPPTFWAGLDAEIPEVDIEGAKALLESVGLGDGFSTTLHSWAAYPFLSNAAIVIQEQLKQIGIEAELDLQENAIYIENYFAGNYDISVTGTSGYVDPNDVISDYFDSNNNAIGYVNERVDELIADGLAVTDLEQRAEIYREIQSIVLEDLPWVSLFIANQYEAYKSYVKGYVHLATGSNASFRDVWLDQ